MTIAIANETTILPDFSAVIPIHEDQRLFLNYYQIGVVQTEKLLPACFHASGSVFYYLAPDASYSFIAGGLQPAPAGFNPESFVSAIASVNFSTAFPFKKLPILFSGKLFNRLENDRLWSDFAAEWLIPEYVFYTTGNHSCLLCINCNNTLPVRILNESTNKNFVFFDGNHTKQETLDFFSNCDLAAFTESINIIHSEISAGRVSKAVLSRKQTAALAAPDFSWFLSSLDRFPATHRFLFKSGTSVFSGASPELLLTLRNNVLVTEALAGTSARGKDDAEDADLTARLLADEKELLEHKIVTDYITSILGKYSDNVTNSTQPGIKKLASLQHLWTPIKAELPAPEKIFAILDELFPTPATCGYPLRESFELINRLENYSRGLYCGAITWTDGTGNVDSFIPLRSALFTKKDVHIFSGGGIVAASEAVAEFEEMQKKADSIKSLFFP
ncbi:MAG: chorismate-binding protein [Ignavibacteriales bacterium]|nr:chorismate-binding protein [Ignavibacteriales bacterium]